MIGTSQQRARLLELLVKYALRTDETVSFRLSSGETSHIYVDCKSALSYPEVRLLLAAIICDYVQLDAFDAVGGLELGAYPIATAISDEWYKRTNKVIRAFVVRKQPKEHGLRKVVEGDIEKGQNALIVDDVVTTGSSVLQAIRGAHDTGLKISRAIAIVDRSTKTIRDSIEVEARFESIFSIDELLQRDGYDAKRRDSAIDSTGLLRE